MTENYKLINGDMLQELDKLEEGSVDCIVTDPPYELGFMGKSWDSAGISFQSATWEKCLRVLKPGGYLLSFGGTRTYHRIACAIEDAGFEIRDTIMWLYGCYSADTQVLTDSGWKYFYNLDKTEKILQWDKDTNELSWIKPLNYFEYDVNTNMCLFENRHISQLVTPNHKVAVSIKKRRKDFTSYELVDAQDIKPSWVLNLPLAGKLDGDIHEDDAYIIGWWLTDAWKHSDGKACMFSQSKLKTLHKLKDYLESHNIKYSEYVREGHNDRHKDEHVFYVTGGIADKLLKEYPDRELSWDVLNWDISSRKALLEGLMDGDGTYRNNEYSMTFWSKDKERCNIVQALCVSLNYRASILIKHGIVSGVVFNIAHNSTQLQTRHHKNAVPYTGKVYCLQTDTGAFVVRRKGKAFISGNSGFPKSMNIGLAIDKKNGVESEVIGYADESMPDFQDAGKKNSINKIGINDGESADRKAYPIYRAKNEWNGWGTCLKPAYEPIIVARKPFNGSLVDNVLENGVGGLNIDECRVPISQDDVNMLNAKSSKNPTNNYNQNPTKKYGDYSLNIATPANDIGRFPANVILTYDEGDYDEVCGGMPDTVSSGGSGKNSIKSGLNGAVYQGGWSHDRCGSHLCGLGDNGSASQYFYCAKASKRDRDEGIASRWLKDIELSIYDVNEVLIWRGTFTTHEDDRVVADTVQSLKRAIDEYGIQSKNDIGWNIILYGKHIMEKSLMESKYITKMAINSTTIFQTLNWLKQWNINDTIQDVKLSTVSNINHVDIAVSTNLLEITISENQASAHDANDAVLKMQLKINEKDGRNDHCTVKPTSLMQYLIKLVAPKGATILDPFMGSGSTGKAVAYENFDRNANYKFIGIELNAEYMDIAKARIDYVVKNPIPIDTKSPTNSKNSTTKVHKLF